MTTLRRDMLVLEMGFSSVFWECDCRTTMMILYSHGKKYKIHPIQVFPQWWVRSFIKFVKLVNTI